MSSSKSTVSILQANITLASSFFCEASISLFAILFDFKQADRVLFACKILVADLEEDSQTKYGLRITKVHSGA